MSRFLPTCYNNNNKAARNVFSFSKVFHKEIIRTSSSSLLVEDFFYGNEKPHSAGQEAGPCAASSVGCQSNDMAGQAERGFREKKKGRTERKTIEVEKESERVEMSVHGRDVS